METESQAAASRPARAGLATAGPGCSEEDIIMQSASSGSSWIEVSVRGEPRAKCACVRVLLPQRAARGRRLVSLPVLDSLPSRVLPRTARPPSPFPVNDA